MLKSLLLSIYTFLNLSCDNIPQSTSAKSITANIQKNPILWTTDWSPGGKYIAIGGDDKLLRIYEAKPNKLLHTYMLPGAIQCLDWNVEGRLLAIALDDKAVQVFDIETKKFVTLETTTGSRALAWNRDGELLAVGDYEGLLHIYNREGKLLKSIKKENTKAYLSVDWHPKRDIILTGSDRIRVFDSSGKMIQNIKHRKEETIILTVKWNPGGAFFATGDYGHKEDGIGSLLQYWKEDGTLLKSLTGSQAEFRNIRWNKSGTLLATASDGLRLWSRNGNIVFKGETKDLLWGIDWDSKSESIITSSEKGTVVLWDSKAKMIKTIL